MDSGSRPRSDSFPSKEITAVLQAVFAVDLWIGLRMGLLDCLRHGMPPARNSDRDFNENYLSDRRWVTSYAGRLARIQRLVLELARATDCLSELPVRLDFNPLENLRGASPLNRYRDRLVEACCELTHRFTPDHLPAVESIIQRSRSELVGGQPDDPLQADFLSCLDDWITEPGTLSSAVDRALLAGSAQLNLSAWDPLRRQRERLLEALGGLAAGQPVTAAGPFRFRLDVLELADRGENESPAESRPKRRRDRLRTSEPRPQPRPAWLRLYCSLIFHSRCSASGLPEETPDASSRCKRLLERIAAPPRANAPEAVEFRRALSELEELLRREAPNIHTEQLRKTAGLQDVFQEVAYYLEDDPRYDAGHDYVEADYSALREAALKELERRRGKA